jgi:predicted Zn-dependent protease
LFRLLGAAGATGLTVLAVVWWLGGPNRERAEALRLARGHNFSSAEPGLRLAFDRDPNDAEVVESLARGYLAAEDPQAEAFLTRWVELRPAQAEPLQRRMEFYAKRKDGEKVMADVRRLRELDPDNHQLCRTAMGQAFSYGYFADAEDLCRACIRQQPDDRSLRTMLAEIRRARGDNVGAAEILDEVLRGNPRMVKAVISRAVLYEEAGQPEKAIPLFREVVQQDPRYTRSIGYRLSLALERTGRHEEAAKVLAEVRRLQDVEVFGEAIKTQPDNLDLQVRLADSLLADGHTQDGLSLLKSVLSRDPLFRPAHHSLAAYFEKQGQTTLAAEHRRLAGP